MSPSSILTVAGLPIGACLGSYIATASIRSLRAEQALKGRSHCDHCGSGLTFLQTIPILSFAGLGGVCSHCGGSIDRTHLVGEAVGALSLSIPYWLLPPVRAAPVAAMGFVLLALSIVDARTRRLPDPLTLLAALTCALLALESGPAGLGLGLACGAATFLLLSAVRFGFSKFKGEPGLGLGDVKLLSALAIWLGLRTPWVLAIAGACGLGFVGLTRPKARLIAFGPFIAVAGWVVGLAREAHWWSFPY